MYKSNPSKRDWRDRKDAWYVRDMDSMHAILPYVLPQRIANEAVMTEDIDITAMNEFLAKKNAENPDFKYTWFHLITAALAKTIYLRPKLNYFFAGRRLYERKNIEIAFNVKNKFADNGGETLAKMIVDKDCESILEQVHSYVRDMVCKVRNNDKAAEGITNQFNLFQYVPRFLMAGVVWSLRVMEYFGHYPKYFSKDDPLFCSVYVSNLGSIKLKADYHHLFEWGNCSMFLVISEKRVAPVFNEDGTYQMRDMIRLSFTMDERTSDGYYMAKSIRLFKQLLQHPELLEQNVATPVDFD